MKTISTIGMAICMAFLFTLSAAAGQSLVETVANGCKVEIETYCKAVTPGEGRVLA